MAACLHFWASVQSGDEKEALEQVNTLLGHLLSEPANKRQGNISWRCPVAVAASAEYVQLLASLKRCEYVHVLLARCFLQGREVDILAKKQEMLVQVSESAGGVCEEDAKRALQLWRNFYDVEHAVGGESKQKVMKQRQGMKKLKKTPNLAPPHDSSEPLAFRVMSKRGGKQPFTSDDAKRAAAKGLATGAGTSSLLRPSVSEFHVLMLAHVHLKSCWLGLVLNAYPLSESDIGSRKPSPPGKAGGGNKSPQGGSDAILSAQDVVMPLWRVPYIEQLQEKQVGVVGSISSDCFI